MSIVLDQLDEKLLEHFRGFVVKKDLVQMLKVGDHLLCRYDTPRMTLPGVLADFKAKCA